MAKGREHLSNTVSLPHMNWTSLAGLEGETTTMIITFKHYCLNQIGEEKCQNITEGLVVLTQDIIVSNVSVVCLSPYRHFRTHARVTENYKNIKLWKAKQVKPSLY